MYGIRENRGNSDFEHVVTSRQLLAINAEFTLDNEAEKALESEAIILLFNKLYRFHHQCDQSD